MDKRGAELAEGHSDTILSTCSLMNGSIFIPCFYFAAIESQQKLTIPLQVVITKHIYLPHPKELFCLIWILLSRRKIILIAGKSG